MENLKEKNQKKIKGLIKRFEKIEKAFNKGEVPFKNFIRERYKLDTKIINVYKLDEVERFNDEFYKDQISFLEMEIHSL